MRDPGRGDGPTGRIVRLARSRPGGVIRWREARDQYLVASESARREDRRGTTHWHVSLKKVLDLHFTRVMGPDDRPVAGYYVLNESLESDRARPDSLEEPQLDSDGVPCYFNTPIDDFDPFVI